MSKNNAYRTRFDFSKIPATIQIPNLIEVQKRSYERFLQMDRLPSERDDAGLQAVFQSVFPITDFRNVSQLEFVDFAIGNWECKCGHLKGLHHLRTTCKNCGSTVITDPFHPGDVLCSKCGTYNANTPDFCNKCGDPVGLQLKYDVSECEERGMTYSAPLKVTMRLTIFEKDAETGNRSIRDIKEQEVFFGDVPLMTENGTFIVNGTERVIVSQLHRSPGVFFETANNRTYFLGKIIPYRGSWVEFEYDQKNVLYVRIDRKRKFLGTIFLRALGLRSGEDILRTFYTVDRLVIRDKKLYWTLDPASEKPTNLLGMKLAHSIKSKSGEEIAHSGRKINAVTLKEIQKAKISEIEIDVSDLEGAWVAGDVVDTTTGEVLLEANSELTADKVAKILESGVVELNLFFPERDDVGTVISQTLKRDAVKTPQEALIEIYRKLRPGDPPTLDTATALFHGMFFDPRKYDFSRVGRLKFNIKLFENQDASKLDNRTLEPEDFYGTIRYLLKLRKNIGTVDDIDHLGNRRVRAVGELLENQFRIGLVRMERAIKEKMSVYQEMSTAMPHDLVNAKPVMAAIREFFGSSQLSQFMDQTNPLSEITHKRRLSALGPGGLSRERAGFEVRDVHPTHYGRICPIETPEGPNIGLISSLSCYARINDYGFIESPYRRVKSGRVLDYVSIVNAGDSDRKVGDHIEKHEAEKLNAELKETEEAGGGTRTVLVLSLGVGRRPPHHRAGQRGTGRQGPHRRRPGQCPQGRQLRAGQPRRSRLHRRQPEAAGFGGGLAGAVPGARRRQPRADGREHAAPVGASAARRSSDRRHRNGRCHRSRFRRCDSGQAQRHHRLGRLRTHYRARRRRASSGTAFARSGQRHLSAHQVQALQPEHLHQPEADRAEGTARDEGPGHRRRSLHRSWRAGAGTQRAGRLHAVARLQLRRRDPGLRKAGERGLLHLGAHRGVRNRSSRHQAGAGRSHARHSERQRNRCCAIWMKPA